MASISINGDVSGSITVTAPTVAGTNTLTLPAATDTLVGKATTDTLTNKTLTAPVISTISNSGTLTLPTGNRTLNVVGPAFSAYPSTTQGAFSAATKINFGAEEFDTNNCFDTSLSRFTPNIAGYYHITGAVQMNGATGSVEAAIYKNGSVYRGGSYVPAASTSPKSVVTIIVFLNGTTDYVELWATSSASLAPLSGSGNTYFLGCFLRGA